MLSEPAFLLDDAGQKAQTRVNKLEDLAHRGDELARMDLAILYDPAREIVSIGYNVSLHRLRPEFYCYDLLHFRGAVGKLCGHCVGTGGAEPLVQIEAAH